MIEWVKVEDGLPAFDTLVLGRRITNNTDEPHYEGMRYYEGDDDDCTAYWIYAADAEVAENVTHWAPLTEPAL